MTPKMPEEYVELRTRQVLMAAWELFSEKGHHETTMRDVAKKMNVSTGVIYKYFKNKDEIIEGLHQLGSLSQKSIFESMSELTDPLQAINTLWESMFRSQPETAIRQASRANLFLWADTQNSPRLKEIGTQQGEALQQELERIFKDAKSSGKISSKMDPTTLANLNICLILGFQVIAAIYDNLNYEEFYDQILSIVLSMIESDDSDPKST